MNKTTIAIAIATSIFGLAITASNAQACGESTFHSGEGMRYHAFISRQPADILVYRPGASDISQEQIYVGLQKAGHKVTVATNAADLAQALTAKKYDVIIAGARDMDVIAAQLGKSSQGPAMLAVLGPNTGNDSAVRERFPHTLQERDGLNQYLKVIEQTMLARRT